jgi:hypothetical protein
LDVSATSYALKEVINFILPHTTYWVRCDSCGTELLSAVPPDQLVTLTPQETQSYLRLRTSLVARVVGILAVLLCWMPFVGLPVCALSWVLNRRSRAWRIASQVGLGVSVAVLALFFAFMILVPPDRPQHGVHNPSASSDGK